MEELKPAKEKIETGKAQLLDAQTELDAAKAQIEQQKVQPFCYRLNNKLVLLNN